MVQSLKAGNLNHRAGSEAHAILTVDVPWRSKPMAGIPCLGIEPLDYGFILWACHTSASVVFHSLRQGLASGRRLTGTCVDELWVFYVLSSGGSLRSTLLSYSAPPILPSVLPSPRSLQSSITKQLATGSSPTSLLGTILGAMRPSHLGKCTTCVCWMRSSQGGPQGQRPA